MEIKQKSSKMMTGLIGVSAALTCGMILNEQQANADTPSTVQVNSSSSIKQNVSSVNSSSVDSSSTSSKITVSSSSTQQPVKVSSSSDTMSSSKTTNGQSSITASSATDNKTDVSKTNVSSASVNNTGSSEQVSVSSIEHGSIAVPDQPAKSSSANSNVASVSSKQMDSQVVKATNVTSNSEKNTEHSKIEQGQKFDYDIPSNTLYGSQQTPFKNDLTEWGVHLTVAPQDTLTGKWNAYLNNQIILKNGTILPAGYDISKYINYTYDPKTRQANWEINNDLLTMIDGNVLNRMRDLSFDVFAEVERIGTGLVTATMTATQNNKEINQYQAITQTPVNHRDSNKGHGDLSINHTAQTVVSKKPVKQLAASTRTKVEENQDVPVSDDDAAMNRYFNSGNTHYTTGSAGNIHSELVDTNDLSVTNLSNDALVSAPMVAKQPVINNDGATRIVKASAHGMRLVRVPIYASGLMPQAGESPVDEQALVMLGLLLVSMGIGFGVRRLK